MSEVQCQLKQYISSNNDKDTKKISQSLSDTASPFILRSLELGLQALKLCFLIAAYFIKRIHSLSQEAENTYAQGDMLFDHGCLWLQSSLLAASSRSPPAAAQTSHGSVPEHCFSQIHQNEGTGEQYCIPSMLSVSGLVFWCGTAFDIYRKSLACYSFLHYKWLDACLLKGLYWCLIKIFNLFFSLTLINLSACFFAKKNKQKKPPMIWASSKSQSCFQIRSATWFRSCGWEGNRCRMTLQAYSFRTQVQSLLYIGTLAIHQNISPQNNITSHRSRTGKYPLGILSQEMFPSYRKSIIILVLQKEKQNRNRLIKKRIYFQLWGFYDFPLVFFLHFNVLKQGIRRQTECEHAVLYKLKSI